MIAHSPSMPLPASLPGALRSVVHRVLVATLFGLLCGSSVTAPAREWVLQASPLRQLAELLQVGPRRQQEIFAHAALSEMISDYREALGSLRGASQRSAARVRRSAEWRAGTGVYVAQLEALRGELESAAQLVIWVGDQGDLILMVDERMIAIEGPYFGRSADLFSRIQTRYCLLEPCPLAARPAFAEQGLPHGVWSFGDDQGAIYSTVVGIQCLFDSLQDRRENERWCKQLAADLGALVRALQAHQRSGRLIEWEHLRLRRASLPPKARVVVGRGGDTLRLELPLLAALAELPEPILVWLRSRVQGRLRELMVERDDPRYSELLGD